MATTLNSEQQKALQTLKGPQNVFLTGAAGSGKSHLLRAYLKEIPADMKVAVLASTGVAAIMLGGRTFHSFFGLGILEGGPQATIDRALKDNRVRKRLQKASLVIIDEVSMLSGEQLQTAETIARKARESSSSWGGLRIIAVGDFAQLPPVNVFSRGKDWAFLNQVWELSDFAPVVLNETMRTKDSAFLAVQNDLRLGLFTNRVRDFLDSRMRARSSGEMTTLFSRRDSVDQFNLEKLSSLDSPSLHYKTEYLGKAKDIESFRKHSPLPEEISLKRGALVMLRQNDPQGAYVNGSLGHIVDGSNNVLRIKLMRKGEEIEVERTSFTLLNADGEPVVVARNFPVNLAWAMTIHKAQGATLDRVNVELTHAWEPGQAYVAVSRVRSADGLFIQGWRPGAILADPLVRAFYERLD